MPVFGTGPERTGLERTGLDNEKKMEGKGGRTAWHGLLDDPEGCESRGVDPWKRICSASGIGKRWSIFNSYDDIEIA
jgi:hypothetical protein